jgi:hypothetical protein
MTLHRNWPAWPKRSNTSRSPSGPPLLARRNTFTLTIPEPAGTITSVKLITQSHMPP